MSESPADLRMQLMSEFAQQMDWVKRCHALKVKELEAKIANLQARNKDLNREVQSLERTNWKKKFDRLKRTTEEVRMSLLSAMQGWGDDE